MISRVLLDDLKGWKLYPEKKASVYGTFPKKLPRSSGHHEEFTLACKGGEPCGSEFDWASPLTETVLPGNIAIRSERREDLTKKKLLWDSENLRFTNHDPANAFIRREFREGWKW